MTFSDGLEILRTHAQQTKAAYFINPPYTVGGKNVGSRLYTHFELDHDKLFNLCSNLAGEFLMTYSNDQEVQGLVRKYHFSMKEILMKSTHYAKMTELLIGCELSWVNV